MDKTFAAKMYVCRYHESQLNKYIIGEQVSYMLFCAWIVDGKCECSGENG